MTVDRETLADLKKVRERLARGWTQNAMARTAGGIATDPTDPSATCWCLVGAIYVELISERSRALQLEDAILGAVGGRSLTRFNDRLPANKPERVLKVLDQIIDEWETA